jgi:hypothetical protein
MRHVFKSAWQQPQTRITPIGFRATTNHRGKVRQPVFAAEYSECAAPSEFVTLAEFAVVQTRAYLGRFRLNAGLRARLTGFG